MLAHLKALETRRDVEHRSAWKFRLVRGLYERGLHGENLRQLLRLIDWLMELPRPAQKRFDDQLERYEEERRMPYVTSWERRGMFKTIAEQLRVKFGQDGAALAPEIEELDDAEKYLDISRVLLTAKSVDEVRRACRAAAAPRRKRKKEGNDKTR